MASLHHENSFIDPVFDAATAVHVSTMLFEGGESITEIVLGVMDTVILAAGFEREKNTQSSQTCIHVVYYL